MQNSETVTRKSGCIMGRCVSGNSPDYKSAFIRTADSILDSQIDQDPIRNQRRIRQIIRDSLFHSPDHSLDRGEFMQELILIHAELSARVGRS